MKIWALGDPHLSLGIEGKKMDIFGENWIDHAQQMYDHCHQLIADEDVLLIPGDISWALKTQDAQKDLDFIGSLPGKKVISKGNHDYWWPSTKKLKSILPQGVFSSQNEVINIEDLSIVGVKLWDNQEFNFDQIINFKPNPKKNEKSSRDLEENEQIFIKELLRLDQALQLLDQTKYKILMCHYPPIGCDMHDSRASKLIDHYQVDLCVFGHLHNVKPSPRLFGKKNHTTYVLSSCDYLGFKPVLINR